MSSIRICKDEDVGYWVRLPDEVRASLKVQNKGARKMVGGIVIETIELPEKIWINCKDTTYKDTCAIYVERNKDSERVVVGDSIWWQGRFAMWTPATREKEDVKIPRLSYSGVGRPDTRTYLTPDTFAE